MELYYNPKNGPVMRAAKMALETGNANYVLIWVPEESENKLKNLLEKTYCERSTQKEKMQNRSIDWYFEIVNRLHYAGRWPHSLSMKFEEPDEKQIVLTVETAIETGNFDEIISVIPNALAGDVRQRFHHVLNKKNYNVNNIAAGRAYVSAFIEFISFMHNLPSVNPVETGHTEH